MQSSSDESAPSTSQGDKTSISSGQNPPVQSNNGRNLQILALNNFPPWAKLVLGSVVLLAIPLYRRVIRTQKLKKTVEAAVEVAETAVELAERMVEEAEKVAEAAEKLAGKVIEALPSGRMKKAAIKLEELAVFVDKNAEGVDSLINTVDDVVDLEIKLKRKNGEEKIIAVKAVAPAST
ncbi:hypothetical protein KFK09_013728 [Dendrobium nobile]|uniref:Uncharacterized protein n=1 Tax=Dendrobium nobile TaxID=94219 RepID=A0A8T3BAI7_DENNO|nr:hypothetical protein KFK09_013728 [Dendrobium nobile]